MNYKESIRALFEAVINVEVKRIEETRRERKDLMRNLIQKRMAQDPRMDINTEHPRNVAVRAGRKGLTPPGQKGGDVQRDEAGNIKKNVYGTAPMLTQAGQITRTSRQIRGKPDLLGKAKAATRARREKANILAGERKRKEREGKPGYISPEQEKENFRRAARNPRGSDDGFDAARDFRATYGEEP